MQAKWSNCGKLCQLNTASLVVLLVMVDSVVPLISDSLGILMQRQPKELDDILPGCFHRVCAAHTHTHNHFTALWTLSGTTWVSQYQKDETMKVKPVWIYWSKRQWVAVASTGPYANLHLPQTDNHTSTPPLSFYRAMHYSAKHGFAIACRLPVCDVGGSGPHRLKILETNCTNN